MKRLSKKGTAVTENDLKKMTQEELEDYFDQGKEMSREELNKIIFEKRHSKKKK